MTISVYQYTEPPIRLEDVRDMHTDNDGGVLTVHSSDGVNDFNSADIEFIKFEESK